ncbi:P-loop containing nucleoside triphosphate hydrolase protein [Cladorrhinum sp. PSN259]|nr:P-loop containing nucleoside triphosphate hydrolase protein [Cladorrhinum sp. PSN259]
MSQSTRPQYTTKHAFFASALIGGIELDGKFVAANPLLYQGYKVGVQLVTCRAETANWNGFKLRIPFGLNEKMQSTNDRKLGRGAFYNWMIKSGNFVTEFDNERVIEVRFPPCQYQVKVELPSSDLRNRLVAKAKDDNHLLLTVTLDENAQVTVMNYGKEFHNGDDSEVHNWVKRGLPMACAPGITLNGLLSQRVFHLVVRQPPNSKPIHLQNAMRSDGIPPPFKYPYGDDHSWNEAHFSKVWEDEKAKGLLPFLPRGYFTDDKSLVTVLAHCAIQDEFWVSEATNRVNKADTLPEATLNFMVDLSDVQRKVEAACSLDPEAPSTRRNLTYGALRGKAWALANEANKIKAMEPISNDEIEFIRALCRHMWRGDGYWEPLIKSDGADLTKAIEDLTKVIENLSLARSQTPMVTKLRELPVVDFTSGLSARYRAALFQEVFQDDRERFGKYMSHAPLGQRIITAPPGFGKTFLLSVAALCAEATIGHVLCSAPTNVAVGNLARRIDQMTASVCDRYNKDLARGAQREHRRLVLRISDTKNEVEALEGILDGRLPEELALSGDTKWTFPLTPSFWVLTLLGSPVTGRTLHPDDHRVLHSIRGDLQKNKQLDSLRAVVSRTMKWAEIPQTCRENGLMIVRSQFQTLLENADFLCTTPAKTASTSHSGRILLDWKEVKARAVIVDDAANMHRTDLLTVTGNALLPCVMAGDRKQLRPAVMSEGVVDNSEHGYLRHRLSKDACISALEWFQASVGIPVYRQWTQLRMVKGLFNMVGRHIYPDIYCQLSYGPRCNPGDARNSDGIKLDRFLVQKFKNEMSLSPAGELLPAFVHCEGSISEVEINGLSRLSKDQVRVALDLAVDMVKQLGIAPVRIGMLSPYKGNVRYIEELRKEALYKDLAGMDAASTVESYQGRERDFMVVVMGTTLRSGPGFTTDENRLCVLLTRQRCGLVIVGDFTAASPNNWRGNPSGDRWKYGKLMVPKDGGKPGEIKLSAAAAILGKVYEDFAKARRVGTVVVN